MCCDYLNHRSYSPQIQRMISEECIVWAMPTGEERPVAALMVYSGLGGRGVALVEVKLVSGGIKGTIVKGEDICSQTVEIATGATHHSASFLYAFALVVRRSTRSPMGSTVRRLLKRRADPCSANSEKCPSPL